MLRSRHIIQCQHQQIQSKARDQKQNYRMNETKSHSGGEGFKICQGVSFAFFGAFWPPNWSN